MTTNGVQLIKREMIVRVAVRNIKFAQFSLANKNYRLFTPGCGRVLCLVPLRTGYASDLGRSGRLASQINHLGAAVTVQHLLLLASMRLSFEPVT